MEDTILNHYTDNTPSTQYLILLTWISHLRITTIFNWHGKHTLESLRGYSPWTKSAIMHFRCTPLVTLAWWFQHAYWLYVITYSLVVVHTTLQVILTTALCMLKVNRKSKFLQLSPNHLQHTSVTFNVFQMFQIDIVILVLI